MAVYFIQEKDGEQLIKIGKANDVLSRFASIQYKEAHQLELLGFIEGDEREEGVLHAVFADYRRRGEWFEACELLLKFIERYARVAPGKKPRRIRGGGRPRKNRKTITINMKLGLDPERDAHVIDMLTNLPNRKRAGFVKQFLRESLQREKQIALGEEE